MTSIKTPKAWNIGPLTRGKPGRHHIEPPLNLPPPSRHCTASMRDPLPPTRAAAVRPGADQHRQFKSKGPF